MISTARDANRRQFSPLIETLVFALFFSLLQFVFPSFLAAAQKPKVRAVTAFVRLEPERYQEQVREALTMLHSARATFEQAGYEVQSVRIATQPFPQYLGGLSDEEAVAFFREWNEFDPEESYIVAIGPSTAGESGEWPSPALLSELLQFPWLNASIVVADQSGVRWEAVRQAARIIKHLAGHSPGGIANFNFAATALVPPHTPFFPGAYHDGPGKRFAVALQSANVVAEAFTGAEDFTQARQRLAESLGAHASAIERIALGIEQTSGWEYRGIDLSPAPLKEVSIGGAVEKLTGAPFGASGTMTAAALITEVLRSLPVQRTGYSGLMVPVLEDSVLAERWSDGTLTLDALLAYSAVCGTGLDTIPLPGDTTVEQLERIIGDMASLAVKLRKPLSARLMPVAGKRAGHRTEFNDPYLTNAVIQPLH